MKGQPERQIDGRIADWVDGQLAGRERDRFVAELRVNAQLRKDLEDYERTVASVRAALQAPTMRTDVADRVMAAIAAGRSSGEVRTAHMRVHPLVWSLASAAALLVVALLVNSWSAPPNVDQRAATDYRREELARDAAKNPPTDLKDFAEGGQTDPQATRAEAGAERPAGADQPGATKQADVDKDRGETHSDFFLQRNKERDGAVPATKPGAGVGGGGEGAKAEAQKKAADAERNDAEKKSDEIAVVELQRATEEPVAPPAHKQPIPPAGSPTSDDAADARRAAAGPGAPAAPAAAAPSSAPEETAAKPQLKSETELAKRLLGGQQPPRTGGVQVPAGAVQSSVLPLVIIEGTVEATPKPPESRLRGAAEKSAPQGKSGQPAPLAQVDDFLRGQLSPPTVSKEAREPVDLPPIDLAGLPSLRLQRLPSASFTRAQETRGDTSDAGPKVETATPATADRVWLVEGSKEDVTQLLGRLSALTSAAKLRLRTDETADVVVPPPTEALELRSQGEAERRAAPQASPTRIVLRFRTTARR